MDETIVFRAGDGVGVTASGEITHRTHDAMHLLVLSTSPVVVGGCPQGSDDLSGWSKVGMLGQLPTQVRGNVQGMDLIVASGGGGRRGRRHVRPGGDADGRVHGQDRRRGVDP